MTRDEITNKLAEALQFADVKSQALVTIVDAVVEGDLEGVERAINENVPEVVYEVLVKRNGTVLPRVPMEFRSYAVCLAAVESESFIRKRYKTKDDCYVEQIIDAIPQKHLTVELVKAAVYSAIMAYY